MLPALAQKTTFRDNLQAEKEKGRELTPFSTSKAIIEVENLQPEVFRIKVTSRQDRYAAVDVTVRFLKVDEGGVKSDRTYIYKRIERSKIVRYIFADDRLLRIARGMRSIIGLIYYDNSYSTFILGNVTRSS